MLICVWAVTAAIYNKPLIMPSFGSVFVSFFALFGKARFYANIGMTFLRALACFALSVVFALPLALASAFSKTFANIFKPFISLLRSVPVIAVILIALIVFSSSVLPIAVGFLTVFPLMYSAFLNALTSEHMQQKLAMCNLYKVRKRDKARYLYLPELLPVSFTQGESLLPLAVKIVVSGEVLAYTRVGLGLAMQSAQLNVETDKLVAYAFVAVLLSVVAQLLVKLVKLICRRCKLCR